MDKSRRKLERYKEDNRDRLLLGRIRRNEIPQEDLAWAGAFGDEIAFQAAGGRTNLSGINLNLDGYVHWLYENKNEPFVRKRFRDMCFIIFMTITDHYDDIISQDERLLDLCDKTVELITSPFKNCLNNADEYEELDRKIVAYNNHLEEEYEEDKTRILNVCFAYLSVSCTIYRNLASQMIYFIDQSEYLLGAELETYIIPYLLRE